MNPISLLKVAEELERINMTIILGLQSGTWDAIENTYICSTFFSSGILTIINEKKRNIVPRQRGRLKNDSSSRIVDGA